MNNIDDLNSLIVAVGALVGYVAWLIRLEAKVYYQEKELKRLENQSDILSNAQKEKDALIWAKIDDMQKSINSILQTMGRIEGKLETHRE